MYLWHFPIILLTTNVNSTSGTPWYILVLQLVLTIVLAELSFRFIEDPLRHGALGKWWKSLRERGIAHAEGTATVVIFAGSFAVLLAIALTTTALATPESMQAGTVGQQVQNTNIESSARSSSAAVSSSPADTVSANAASTSSASTPSSPASTPSRPLTATEAITTARTNTAGKPIYDPLLIGDSVSAGAVDEFYQAFPNGYIDSAVSRNVWESPYEDYAAEDQVGDYVVFCLGTNNAVVDWQIDDELLNVVPESKHVYMVNTRSPQEWCASTNEVIEHVPERHPNVTVVDWYAASAGHDEYFAGDGTHLTSEGAEAYMNLIKDAIVK